MVTAGLKCAPQTPASEATSSASVNAWTRPMTAQSVKPSAASRGQRDDEADEEDEHERADQLRDIGASALRFHGVLPFLDDVASGLPARVPMLRPRMTRTPSRSAVLLLLAAACALAGCGGAGRAREPAAGSPPRSCWTSPRTRSTRARIWPPAAATTATPACASTCRRPSSSTDAVKLLRAGRADLAYLDIHDLAIADQRSPGSLVAVMALVQRPLASVLASPGRRAPARPRGPARRRQRAARATARCSSRSSAATAATRTACAR